MDPLSLAFAAGASLAYGAYLRQQPTTDTVVADKDTVPDQRVRQRHRKMFISKPDLTVYQGLSGTEAVMLANKRAINSLPADWRDSKQYIKWRRQHRALYRKSLQAYSIGGGDNYKGDVEQEIYDKVCNCGLLLEGDVG